jgi:hypothetical protein
MDIKSKSSQKNKDEDRVQDTLEKNSISSIKSSKSSKARTPPQKNDIQSIDISMSQLEMLANKQKLNKKSPEVSVGDILSANETSQGAGSHVGRAPTRKTSAAKMSNSELSLHRKASTSSEESSYERNKQKKRERLANKENRNEEIRRQKSEYLYKFNKLNVKGKWSSLRLDMECTLDEIRK